ncbi:vacuolar protein sorting-associated protein 26B-like [Uranotaenia lowii]|uniref:vacuolar protein sorting-associated protein 26B-like n=1 Tax=Uranotaenia lowii TaxID=190385 RepID=UPI002478B9D9|nr:vacuolar protein sorting-associated protein 26B-like [Uranotaenia lowii]
MNLLNFGKTPDIDIVFDGSENRQYADIKTEDGKKEKYLLYYDGETVSGKVNITLKKPGSKLEHQGIKVELIGQIELYYDRGNHHDFLSLVRELARPGDLIQNTSYPFEFANVEKPYEVYVGSNVRLRYFLRVTIVRRFSDVIREVDIAVHTLSSYPDTNSPIKMEVGIEDCLHIEFEYNKSKYHLRDVIVGKIYFLLVRIKIKHMEIAIIKREQTGSGPNMFTENEIIAKYEIMDGSPVKGESIPIRVFLAGYDLTLTMREINKKFSVRYFLNLVLIDTEDRRYFKQQEITLWRKADKIRKSLTPSQAAAIVSSQGGQLPPGAVLGQSQPQANATNPHVPHHLVGQGPSLLHKEPLLGDDLGGADRKADENNPIMGLFTEDSSQTDARPKPAVRQQIRNENEQDDDEEPSSMAAVPIAASNNNSEDSRSGAMKSVDLGAPITPTNDATDNDDLRQQPHLHREAGDGAASISHTTDEETSSLFDANDLSFNANSNPPAATTAVNNASAAPATSETIPNQTAEQTTDNSPIASKPEAAPRSSKQQSKQLEEPLAE